MTSDSLLDRFLRYVRIDTQSNEDSSTAPSTEKQLDLSRLLAEECQLLGLADVSLSQHGVVMATIPPTVDHDAPTIVWLAHVDTSPEYSGANVNPIVHENYQGGDIVLPNDGKVVTMESNPGLRGLVGATIVTTDGTTLLGADDKAGIAEIMSAADHLIQNPDILHGPIRICFTCDEEIGRGIDHLDLQLLGGVCAYTLDGEGQGKVDSETFSADQAVVTVEGINTHPSVGKDSMVNSLRIVAHFLSKLPEDRMAPEVTDGRDGFIHPYRLEGGVAKATAHVILRDFETKKLEEQANILESIAAELREEYPKSNIGVQIHRQYRNLRDGLVNERRAIPKVVDAMQAIGIKPEQTIIRGGTDGSLLTEAGLPTPNLSSGQHNPHSPLEWTSVEEMQAAVDVLVQLAIEWGKERI